MKTKPQSKPTSGPVSGAAVDLLFPEIPLTLKAQELLNTLRIELLAFVKQHARLHGSKVVARERVLEHCPDQRTRRIVSYLLAGEKGRPLSNKRLTAARLLTLCEIYKSSNAPAKITDADFAEWYLYHAPKELLMNPRLDRKTLSKGRANLNEIRAFLERLRRARQDAKSI